MKDSGRLDRLTREIITVAVSNRTRSSRMGEVSQGDAACIDGHGRRRSPTERGEAVAKPAVPQHMPFPWLTALVGVALVALLAPPPARAAFEASDLQPIVFAGRIAGTGANETVEIDELRLGLGHYFRDRLGFYGELSLYRPQGTREGRSADTNGLGPAYASCTSPMARAWCRRIRPSTAWAPISASL